MTIQRNSPSRRNSFAVANRTQAHPGRKRRAHSIAPGDPLSPAARARRSLAPRKSILKAAVGALDDGDDATQSMDITRDYREDNPTRKSLRVSFANHAHVRLFEVPDHNTNSTTSPQSSPAVEPEPDASRTTNDENAYPGAQKSRRRSSARYSMAVGESSGEESMDMDSDDTGFSPSAFFRAGTEAPIEDDFNHVEGMYDDDDMDVTEVVPRDIVRKSLSVGRQPLANLSIPQLSTNVHDDQQDVSNDASYVEEESAQSQSFASEGDPSQPMEFTVPLVRPPEPPSEAWLALRSATHSGNTPYIPSSDDDGEGDGDDVRDMELTDAVSRLQAARPSLVVEAVEGEGEDSFTSTEDSFMDDDVGIGEDGNQTVNVTQLMKRASIGHSADSTVTSVFSSQEQSKGDAVDQLVSDHPPDSSQGIYPSIPEPPMSAITPAEQALYPELPIDDPITSVTATMESTMPLDRPPVFSVPQPLAPEVQSTSPENISQPTGVPDPLNFTFASKHRAPTIRSRSSSPVKVPPSPRKFTAAFAPPAARLSPQKRASDASNANHVAQPSPVRPPGTERLSITPGRGTGAVRIPLPLPSASPLKLALFHAEEQPGTGPRKHTSVGFRRPSGYFAQRKSLGNVFPDPTTATNTGAALRASPVRRVAISPGPKSFGSIGHFAEKNPIDGSTVPYSASPTELDDTRRHERPSERPSSRGEISIRRAHSMSMGPDDQSADPGLNDGVRWRSEVEEDAEDSQAPRITIEQFFEMTGIRFMDDIAAPRRSIVHPSTLRSSRRASTEAQIPLAEYVVAMAVNVPQLELCNHVTKDLQTWIERTQEIHKEAEDEAQKATPSLFQEFVATDESGQAELLHQLKLIKVHNHAQAKSEWYDWKAQWVEQLYQKANEGFVRLEADAKTLEGIIRQAQEIVPSLQQEYDELIKELAKERAEVADLEESDQTYLSELKATLAEQSAELDTFRADVEEAEAKLDRLEEKLSEVESQKKEVMSTVEDAERRIHMQKSSTRAEIFQLKNELEALQSLHMLKVTKILPESFEFVYASTYCVSIPCIKFHPVVGDIQIIRVENVKTMHNEILLLSTLMLQAVKQHVARRKDQGIREIVQCLGDYWSSCSQLQLQLKLVSIRFPLLIEETPTGFSATATILFRSLKAKALISFIFDTPVFSSWPILIHAMHCDVKVAYGPIDRDVIQEAVTSRIGQASPVSNHGFMLDACMEATERYS